MTVDSLDALRARDDLLAVAASWGALRAQLTPSAGADILTRTAPKSRPPLVVEVSDLMLKIRVHAQFLGQILLAETSDFKPSTSTMPGLLVDVAHRFGHFTQDDDEKFAADFCKTAHDFRRKVRGILARAEPPRFVGVCPESICDGEIYQRLGQLDAVCRSCGREVGPVEWRALMEAAFDSRLMTFGEVVSALVITNHGSRQTLEKTVGTWVYRGKLPKVYEAPDLFRFSDAWNLAERRAQRSKT